MSRPRVMMVGIEAPRKSATTAAAASARIVSHPRSSFRVTRMILVIGEVVQAATAPPEVVVRVLVE